ncbi:MAG: decaprenyl-phosphate phosphoribosyltransferase [Georgfuchsia sp.]
MPPLIRLLRPHQWLKNGFVLVGLLFAHAWNDAAKVEQALLSFVVFCLLSSAVYIFNDFLDRASDRLHPTKRLRPLASGTISVNAALTLMAACLASGLWLAFEASAAPWIFLLYIALNIGYTCGLKHVVVLDVFLIAAGFMLRLLAGTIGIGIAPSHWLLLCGLMLTLFLGFAKRRAELAALPEDASGHRRVLDHYSEVLLDQFLTVAAACTVVTYSLYTVSNETMTLHGSNHLMLTVPFVLYGLLHYMFRLQQRGGGGDPSRELFTDPHLIAAVAGWLLTTLAILAGRL